MPFKEARPLKVEEKILNDGTKIPLLDGRAACSQRDPLREAKDWFNREKSKFSIQSLKAKPVVVLGSGAGLHLLELWRSDEIGGRIYVIELEPDLFRWNQAQQAFPADKVKFINLAERDEFLSEIKPQYPIVAEFRPGFLTHTEEYMQIFRELVGDQNIKQILNEETSEMSELDRILWKALGELIK